jgi:hypothetical protein
VFAGDGERQADAYTREPEREHRRQPNEQIHHCLLRAAGRQRPGKRLLREMEDRRRGASTSLRSPQGAAGWRQPPRSTVPSLSRYVSTRPASSKRRKLAILIWPPERKDPIRTQATAHPMARSEQMLAAPPTVVGLGQDRPVPIFQRLAGDRPPGRDDVCGPYGHASRRSSLARRTDQRS